MLFTKFYCELEGFLGGIGELNSSRAVKGVDVGGKGITTPLEVFSCYFIFLSHRSSTGIKLSNNIYFIPAIQKRLSTGVLTHGQ
tara:strand:- start:896 stop:1147 length:252 start_codon:yes stop_codon:yes gene_type:complete